VDRSASQEVIAKATSSASDGLIFSKQRLQGVPYSKTLEQKQALLIHWDPADLILEQGKQVMDVCNRCRPPVSVAVCDRLVA